MAEIRPPTPTADEYAADIAAVAARRAKGIVTEPGIHVAAAPEGPPSGWVDVPKTAAPAPASTGWTDVPRASTPDTPKARPGTGDTAGWVDVPKAGALRQDEDEGPGDRALQQMVQPFKDLWPEMVQAEKGYRSDVTEGVGRVLGEPVPSEEPGGQPTPPTLLQRGGGALQAVGGVLGYPFAPVKAASKALLWNPVERMMPSVNAETMGELTSAATQIVTGSPMARAGVRALATGAAPQSERIDDLRRIFNPATRGEAAAKTASGARQYMAEAAQSEARAAEALRAFNLDTQKLTQAERYGLIDDIEAGRPPGGARTGPRAAELQKLISLAEGQLKSYESIVHGPHYDPTLPQYQFLAPNIQSLREGVARYKSELANGSGSNRRLAEFAQTMRAELDQRMDAIHALGPGHDLTYIENYVPHLWSNPQGAAGVVKNHMAGKRSLEGSKDFTRARHHMTFREGLNEGLVPVTDNPVELAMLRIHTMDRYITGQKLFGEMKADGLAKFVKSGDMIPAGWVEVEGAPRALGGAYYAPEQAATIIKNMLSPGFTNPLYTTARATANMMNQAQLGMSMFHMGFVTMDAMISKVALGTKQLSRGEVVRGSANIAKGLSPTTPLMNFLKGRKLLKQYLGTGQYGQEMEAIVDGLIKAGGRVSMDKFYRGSAAGSFWDAMRHAAAGGATAGEKAARGAKAIGQETKEAYRELGAVGGTARTVARVIDSTAAPMMEYLVPRMKLGVFFDMMQAELKRNPTMTLVEKRQVAQKLWDSVDNRMGQLVYDNLFWNKALKDLTMIGIRSVGWNLGTIREVGGGVADIAKSAKGVARGEGITDRTAYTIAMPVVTALYGGMYQYLKTGETPQTWMDWFNPKTGGSDERGNEERMNLPTYMRDVTEYLHDPKGTAINKINPLPSAIAQQLDNRDFFKGIILDAADPKSYIRQESEFIAKQFIPFGMRQQGLGDESNLPFIERFFGARKAPSFTINPERAEKFQNRDTQRARKIKQKMDARE